MAFLPLRGREEGKGEDRIADEQIGIIRESTRRADGNT
jgi:hypothetical protein